MFYGVGPEYPVAQTSGGTPFHRPSLKVRLLERRKLLEQQLSMLEKAEELLDRNQDVEALIDILEQAQL